MRLEEANNSMNEQDRTDANLNWGSGMNKGRCCYWSVQAWQESRNKGIVR